MDPPRGALEQRILLLAPTGKDAALTESILGRAGIACCACRDLEEVSAGLTDGAAAVLLVEEAVTQGRNALTDWLAGQLPWSDLPVLVLARPGADSTAVAQAMDLLGNVTVLERPTRVAALVSAARTALRARQRQYQLREQVAALHESEARFRMLADNMAQLAWSGDRLGEATWYNRRWFEYTGLTFEEMQGWGWSKVQHPDHVAHVVAGVERSAATGEVWEDTFPLRGRDGSYRWFLSRAVPIRDDAGRIVHWFGTNTDVTEQRALEMALRDAARRKDEFLAMLAHELRNPLAPIRNGLHILRLTGRQDPATERVGEMMERQVNHMVRLVDDLLEVSRITRGNIELRREEVELAVVVRNAVETSRPLIDAGGHDLSVALPPEPMPLEGDPVRLAQVFANLLNNASKYTDRGGQISLSAAREGDTVRISVRDTGTGIEPEMLPRVFEMFTQIDRNSGRAQGGLGIGLTLVKRLVEMHGGSVEAHSAGLGHGSEFVVRLPLLAAAAARRQAAGAPAQAAWPATRRVLVVDDNRDAAESLAALLQLLGVEVQVELSGRDALKAFASYKPAVVLLDIGMPGMDGYEVARRIREKPEARDVTLIALTGWGQAEDRRRTQAAGFDHHLVKPAEIDTLQMLLLSLEGAAETR